MDLPDPEDALTWFLVNVIALPVPIVTLLAVGMWAWAWISASRSVVKHGSVVLERSSEAIRSGPIPALIGAVCAQVGFIAITYALGQLVQFVNLSDVTGAPVVDYQSFDLGWTLRATFYYDHWTPISRWVVQGAIAFVLLVDLLCLMTRKGESVASLVVYVPAIGAAVIAALLGLLGLISTDAGALERSGFLGVWAVILVALAFLASWSCELPRAFVDTARDKAAAVKSPSGR
ncbi:hypothetical protein OHA10_08920 [Kribbella sp. NBC_00662]|uniref:hypothetical protein n=1 Tax=Kribbella sp. NBC_00662 TaxID=2975969 RepID=UPI003243C0FA